VICLQTPTVLR